MLSLSRWLVNWMMPMIRLSWRIALEPDWQRPISNAANETIAFCVCLMMMKLAMIWDTCTENGIRLRHSVLMLRDHRNVLSVHSVSYTPSQSGNPYISRHRVNNRL